ncbi:MAG: YdcF family protein [Zetaproteobacteria bacterium]|nr:MAG: YdcF family protein [Zetaproteobacteria bacterium]
MSLTLSKLVGQWLLPPGVLAWLALLAFVGWRRVWARVLVLFVAVSIWLLSVAPVQNALLRPLEQAQAPLRIEDPSWRQADAIVLLGGGTYESPPEYAGHDMPSKEAMLRTIYAARLARLSGLDVYASGGVPPQRETQRPEGESMAEWLAWFGVPPQRIHAETRAMNTWENARYLRAMLPQAQRIVLVTSAFHMPRARWAFEQQGFRVIAAPCAYRRDLSAQQPGSWFTPKAGLFEDSYAALHEYLGLVWYRWRYAAPQRRRD